LLHRLAESRCLRLVEARVVPDSAEPEQTRVELSLLENRVSSMPTAVFCNTDDASRLFGRPPSLHTLTIDDALQPLLACAGCRAALGDRPMPLAEFTFALKAGRPAGST
jgi:hypothetical protein